MQDRYIPGVCNIGKSEIKRRKQAGWIGLIATIILYGMFVYLGVPRFWRFVIFVPALISAIGFLQAYMDFCAYFGLRGIFNFGAAGKTDTVEQAEFRVKDRNKALEIIIYSVIVGIAAAILAHVLPL